MSEPNGEPRTSRLGTKKVVAQAAIPEEHSQELTKYPSALIGARGEASIHQGSSQHFPSVVQFLRGIHSRHLAARIGYQQEIR